MATERPKGTLIEKTVTSDSQQDPNSTNDNDKKDSDNTSDTTGGN